MQIKSLNTQIESVHKKLDKLVDGGSLKPHHHKSSDTDVATEIKPAEKDSTTASSTATSVTTKSSDLIMMTPVDAKKAPELALTADEKKSKKKSGSLGK